MSAESASSSSAVGSSSSFASSFVGASMTRGGRAIDAVADDLDAELDGFGERVGREHQVGVVDVVVVLVLVGLDGDRRAAGAQRREPSLLEVGLAAARAGEDRLDELLVQRICHQGALRVVALFRSGRRPAGRRGVPARVGGRASDVPR